MVGRIAFFFVGGVLALILLVGVVGAVQSMQIRTSYTRVAGTVVDVDQGAGSGGGLEFTPIIQFSTTDGETWQFRSSVTENSRPARTAAIDVLYDPSDPASAVEDTFAALWLVPVMMIGVGGAGLTLLGLLGWRIRRNGRRNATESRQSFLNRNAEIVDATFSHVQPRGPDNKGRFQYRVVAVRKVDGVRFTYHSDWVDENPTVAIMNAGNEMRVRLNPDGSGEVVLDVDS